ERPVPVEKKRPGMPLDLARAVMMLLEKDPINRFPNAQALVTALETGNVPELPPAPPANIQYGSEGRDRWDMQGTPRSTPQQIQYDADAPTPNEMARWGEPAVVSFRRT